VFRHFQFFTKCLHCVWLLTDIRHLFATVENQALVSKLKLNLSPLIACFTCLKFHQGRNEVRWHSGQEASLASPCLKVRSFGSSYTVVKKVLVTFLGLCDDPAVIRRPLSDSASGELFPPFPPRYALHSVTGSRWPAYPAAFLDVMLAFPSALRYLTHQLAAKVACLFCGANSWPCLMAQVWELQVAWQFPSYYATYVELEWTSRKESPERFNIHKYQNLWQLRSIERRKMDCKLLGSDRSIEFSIYVRHVSARIRIVSQRAFRSYNSLIGKRRTVDVLCGPVANLPN